MKRKYVLFIAIALGAVVAYFVYARSDGGAVVAAGAAAGGGLHHESTIAQKAPVPVAAGTAAQRVPAAGAAGEVPAVAFKPPVFRALPEGLNGRQLRDIYDTLAKAAEGGDAKAASTLGKLVDECRNGLREVEDLQQKKITTYHTDATVNRLLQEKYEVIGKQCVQLTKAELGGASHWLLLGAKGGDRRALLRLPFYAPDKLDPDYDAKNAAWRETVATGLDKLAQAGDTEAAIALARYYLSERNADNLKSAYKYFDLVSKSGSSARQIEYATKMRDYIAAEIARGQRSGS